MTVGGLGLGVRVRVRVGVLVGGFGVAGHSRGQSTSGLITVVKVCCAILTDVVPGTRNSHVKLAPYFSGFQSDSAESKMQYPSTQTFFALSVILRLTSPFRRMMRR